MVQGQQDMVVAGYVWFTRDSYPRCIAIFDDPDQYPMTFDDWLVDAERTEQAYRRRGIQVIRVEIDPNTFPAWCAANGHKLDAEARSHFANLKAAESVGIHPAN